MISLDEWQQHGQFEQFNGQQIFTRTGGLPSAPALLLIHGFPSASWDWEGMWQQLTERYYVITLDMLGFGLSDKPKNSEYLISQQADIYQALLAKLGMSEYHILAHDYGDTVAQELLARQVDGNCKIHINSVCLLNGGLFPETHKPVLIQKLLLSPLGSFVAKKITKQKFAANLHHIFGPATPPTSEVVDTLWQLLTHNDGIAVMHKLITYMTQRKQHRQRWVGALVNSPVPVKLIAGALDPISGQHMIDRYGQLISNANITTMPTLGHYPQVEDATAITAAYLQFRQSIE
ncbi:epoxide hydrolase [Shewanella algicola]|uniref:Alpha/beta hydrolase n=1 Tax=Shewanella algicola TaxID=640633 RepID=A0A9X1Z330_9GAMM|nr:alpha/beta hydrolase [Shewanella algicola]MCL1104781.1 alpha/beta hydrolase [Shewanella algicola]GGP45648.1 epoxide hydrolase [Shewanella algicola]